MLHNLSPNLLSYNWLQLCQNYQSKNLCKIPYYLAWAQTRYFMRAIASKLVYSNMGFCCQRSPPIGAAHD